MALLGDRTRRKPSFHTLTIEQPTKLRGSSAQSSSDVTERGGVSGMFAAEGFGVVCDLKNFQSLGEGRTSR